MAHRKSLTQAQLEVLQWIDDGCPAGVMENYDHRVSAAALKRRGLVSTQGRGPTWSAKATAEGRDYLNRSKEPDAPVPRQANQSVTEKLVADITAAGGTLLVPIERGKGGVDYRKRAAAAERHGKVPEGKRLDVKTDQESWVIKLADIYRVPFDSLDEIPVPAKVARYHPVVRRFRDEADRHEISKAQTGRALRLLQALVVAAERKGFKVENVEEGEGRYGNSRWSGAKDGHVQIITEGQSEALRIHETGLPSRVWWEQQSESRSRPHFFGDEKEREPMPGYEEKATGRLCLEFVGYSKSQRPSTWTDNKKKTLEAKLPEVLLEVEERAIDSEERQREAERVALARREKWEAARAQATVNYIHAFNGKFLEEDVANWQRSVRIREFCDAAEAKFGGESSEDEAFRAWMSWSRSYADDVDPLKSPPTAPNEPENISGDQLKPFMGGWSPYGPENRGW